MDTDKCGMTQKGGSGSRVVGRHKTSGGNGWESITKCLNNGDSAPLSCLRERC